MTVSALLAPFERPLCHVIALSSLIHKHLACVCVPFWRGSIRRLVHALLAACFQTANVIDLPLSISLSLAIETLQRKLTASDRYLPC